ncbi:MAG: aminoglycoside/hydroxyurea antibiotic resistance kinase [Anaerolineae bacterium]|nr:MAG: aminoglycoside/hydroxyurea antibiotic resistance kinase [Anaerolineae bacterium]WKZ44149.1 MAG: aminoglycoside phosphotransferase family protein [Anaerolineales bacterium]WKZ44156.1 MAG: aminoglycoside phosphotransferase family protein [Anaerolineales bacterium]
MYLPADFVSTVKNTFGEDGEKFLADLPLLINEASTRWGLRNVQPVSNLSYNFVAYATSPSPLAPLPKGEGNVVLKIGVPRGELTSEIAALRLFNGEGACRLIDCDEPKGFLLLERLKPGRMLAEVEDDEEATRIAAEVMRRIWAPLENVTLSDSEGSLPKPQGLFGREERSLRVTNKFILLSKWFDGLKRLRKMFDGKTGPLDAKLVERVERSTKDFFAENHQPVLMHGDFHHYNVLSSERGWLAIDPKGVIGPACYEVGPLMLNPWGTLMDRVSPKLVKKRVDILHEFLGFERERILEWSLAHAVLSAWWGIEDNTGWEYSLAFAKMIASL